MKIIKYKILGYTGVFNSETGKVEQKECFAEVVCPYSDAAYQDALSKAYNGEVTVEDDGQTETPSQLDTIEAQVTYTAMITDTLIMVD